MSKMRDQITAQAGVVRTLSTFRIPSKARERGIQQ